MERSVVEAKVRELNNDSRLAGSEMLVIEFTDGERSLTPVWSVSCLPQGISYIDAHTSASSKPIVVQYQYIKRVFGYSQECQTKNDTNDHYTNHVLDADGRPRNPRSISQGVQRAYISRLDFVSMMRSEEPLSVPSRNIGRWELVRGRIERVVSFPDGTLLYLKPLPGGVFNAESWKRLYFWVANEGSCGVL